MLLWKWLFIGLSYTLIYLTAQSKSISSTYSLDHEVVNKEDKGDSYVTTSYMHEYYSIVSVS